MNTKLFGEDIFRANASGAAAYRKLAHPSPDFRFFYAEQAVAAREEAVKAREEIYACTVSANPLPPAHPKDAWLTELAAGAKYPQYIAAGWTDELLEQHRIMVVPR